jgi:hypothetical protein
VLQCQAEQGFKNIKNSTSLDYDLLSQKWCITRDTRGIIYAANQGVFFRASKQLFRWHNGHLTAWQPRNPQALFMAVFSWKDVCYVQERSVGLLRVKGDEFLQVKGNPVFTCQRIWNDGKKNPLDLALRWLWNKPEISVVLSGRNTMKQVIENVGIADMSGIDTLYIEII